MVASHWFSAQTTPKHKAFHVRFCPRVGDKLPHYEPIAYSLKDLTTWRRIHVGLSDFEGLHPENKPEALLSPAWEAVTPGLATSSGHEFPTIKKLGRGPRVVQGSQ